MLWYAHYKDLIKTKSPPYSKEFQTFRSEMISQSVPLICNVNNFSLKWKHLKWFCMLYSMVCYDELESMRLYVCYDMQFKCYGVRFQCSAMSIECYAICYGVCGKRCVSWLYIKSYIKGFKWITIIQDFCYGSQCLLKFQIFFFMLQHHVVPIVYMGFLLLNWFLAVF